jgi:hypothetical protein
VLILADTLHTALCCHFVYAYLVTHFGDIAFASRATHTFSADPILTSIIALMAQSFFAWRIWKLTRSPWVPGIIMLTGGLSMLAAIGTTIGVEIVREFAKFQKFQVAVIIWLACAAVADGIITTGLIMTLNKSRTGFTQTDDVISKLIRLTLQTGLLTASVAAIDLILFCASTTTAHLLFNLPLAKLYVNSLLSTLNARAVYQDRQRYTMGSSSNGTNGVGAGMHKEDGGGNVHFTSSARGRHSRFNATASGDSEREQAASRTASFFRQGKSAAGGREIGVGQTLSRGGGNADLEGGIQITTIEERYEDPPALAMLPHISHAHGEKIDERGAYTGTNTPTGTHPYSLGAEQNKSLETTGTGRLPSDDDVYDDASRSFGDDK